MDLRRPLSRIACVAGVVAGLGLAFFAVRPWYRSWGASAAEHNLVLPGDEIVPTPASQETRGITIQAPADRVFAWVSQIGQDRGGFYSYRILENLVGCEMPYVDRLDPKLQQWRVGDKLWMYPARKAGGIGHVVLRVLVPGRALGFGSLANPTAARDDGSWSFIVRPVDEHSTRLLFRGRSVGQRGVFATAFTLLAFEPMHFAMERRTLKTIKQLAEGERPCEWADNLQVLLWTVTFICFLASVVLVLAGRQPQRRLATGVASGLLFMLLTLVQPTPFLGLPLVLGLVAAVWWPRLRRRPVRPSASE